MPVDTVVSQSDVELASAFRELASGPAAEELYRRHRAAVFAYARTCCRDPHTAEDLVSEAFARTLRAVRSGGGPESAWRPYLLTVVRRIAADWAGTARRTELSADFEQWLSNVPETPEAQSSEERILRLEDNSLVLRAFRSLPERWQAVLWHTAVEEEPASKVGALLGVGASGVGSLASRAREGLREAYLTAHAEHASVSKECRRYSSLLGAAVRRTGRRPNKDLDRHLAQCAHCRQALIELTDLNRRLGSALSEGVPFWDRSAGPAARMAKAGPNAADAAMAPGTSDGGRASRARTKHAPQRSGAVISGVATAIVLVALNLATPLGDRGDRPTPPQVESKPTLGGVEHPPRATFTATPFPSTEPTTKQRARFGTVTWSGALRNAGINTQCVEPVGSAVVQNTCNGAKGQVWQTVSVKDNKENKDYSWLRNAATGECIDYRGSRQKVHDTASYVRITMGPCRIGGEGQLFRFDQSRGESDGSYVVRAEPDGSKPWGAMQLGMLDWREGDDSPPQRDVPVVLTYNYDDSSRLHYLAVAAAGDGR